ncbi:MAG: hypothetical protein IJP82_04075 [Bacteroidaceae bacterium]|nr:hypothetical protein [Bacteroidaceae bacterium]
MPHFMFSQRTISIHIHALKGIAAAERFYHAIGMPNSIHELIGLEVTEMKSKKWHASVRVTIPSRRANSKLSKRLTSKRFYRMAR